MKIKYQRWRILIIAIITINSYLHASDNYYRLDNFDANYNKLKDPPIKINPNKNLHPSSIYKPQRPPRIKKEPNYNRIEIINNQQAINRLNGYRQTPPRLDYFLFGGGIGVHTQNNKRQSSINLYAINLYAKFGYFRYVNLNAIRAYINLGIPINHSNLKILSFSGNIDFLLNIKIFHIYAGFGGEYYTRQKILAQRLNVNLGINKEFGSNGIDIGVVIPFYTIYTRDMLIKNNIIFTLGYSYRI